MKSRMLIRTTIGVFGGTNVKMVTILLCVVWLSFMEV